MRTPIYATQFRKDYKRCQKRGYAMQKLIDVMIDLENEVPLSPQLKEHPLQGEYAGSQECHLEPDWLVIYEIDDDIKEVYFVRTGTHSDLF
jgi:mRNA interferase YafQ